VPGNPGRRIHAIDICQNSSTVLVATNFIAAEAALIDGFRGPLHIFFASLFRKSSLSWAAGLARRPVSIAVEGIR
jgi:hypothetical protein